MMFSFGQEVYITGQYRRSINDQGAILSNGFSHAAHRSDLYSFAEGVTSRPPLLETGTVVCIYRLYRLD